ncbi:unnamed protein product, partial [Mesorhabditis spiculigera]
MVISRGQATVVRQQADNSWLEQLNALIQSAYHCGGAVMGNAKIQDDFSYNLQLQILKTESDWKLQEEALQAAGRQLSLGDARDVVGVKKPAKYLNKLFPRPTQREMAKIDSKLPQGLTKCPLISEIEAEGATYSLKEKTSIEELLNKERSKLQQAGHFVGAWRRRWRPSPTSNTRSPPAAGSTPTRASSRRPARTTTTAVVRRMVTSCRGCILQTCEKHPGYYVPNPDKLDLAEHPDASFLPLSTSGRSIDELHKYEYIWAFVKRGKMGAGWWRAVFLGKAQAGGCLAKIGLMSLKKGVMGFVRSDHGCNVIRCSSGCECIYITKLPFFYTRQDSESSASRADFDLDEQPEK